MYKTPFYLFCFLLFGCTDMSQDSDDMYSETLSIEQLVESLELEPHIEGGYFKQTYKADNNIQINTKGGDRVTMTSIYYLLTADSPVGHFHQNQSDIMHYFHAGDPITYYLIQPDGSLETKVLGPDVLKGHQFQFVVKGGVWKASSLPEDPIFGYGLIGESVAPGFEYQDMKLGKLTELVEQFPQHRDLFSSFSR